MILSLAISNKAPLVTSPVSIFLIVLAIILLAPILLKRLKIPHVIGMIIAGVVVGSHGLNILARDMSFEVFGQVGLLYLMFLAGVEIDMYHLRKNLRRGAVFGVYTFLVPLAAGTVAACLLLHLSLMASLLMASMFAAHTLLAYPIVSRFGLTRNKAVVIAIAGTIFTVLGSLMVLASVVGVVREGEWNVMLLLRLSGQLLLYCVALVYLYPRLTRWFFKHYNDGVSQFVYVLVMVFLAAQTAALIGLEGVFGAFFAGLVLNRFIPARSPLMSRLVFVGNALFIPYFLIGVGMLINVGVLFTGWTTLYVAAVMSAVAMMSKWVAAYMAQRTFSMAAVERSIMYQLSNAHTAVALAVVMIGYEMHLFDESILNGTILMILVTCTVSSVGTARAAARLKVQTLLSEDTLSDGADRKRRRVNTLIPVVNPMTATELVNLAIMMHDNSSRQANLFGLHVRNDNSPSSRAVGKNSLDVAEYVASTVDVSLTPIDRYDLNFVTGVLNTIEERDIDEVVIGLHRRSNVIDSFFGDKLTQLLKATYRMVVISRCYIPVNTVRRIVVAVPDKAQYESGFSRWVCAVANLARQLGCRIIFCCSGDTRRSIAAVLRINRFTIRSEYRDIEQWDDFILLANKILDEDLFVVISARRASVSFSSEMDGLPEFLRKYFSQNNLIVIYPEQFGEEAVVPVVDDALSSDVVTAPSPLWLKLKDIYRSGLLLKNRLSRGHRKNRIEL